MTAALVFKPPIPPYVNVQTTEYDDTLTDLNFVAIEQFRFQGPTETIFVNCIYTTVDENWTRGRYAYNWYPAPYYAQQSFWYDARNSDCPNCEGQDSNDKTHLYNRWICKRRRNALYYGTPGASIPTLFSETWNVNSDNRYADVICNYQDSFSSVHGKEYVCFDTVRNRVLGTEEWPTGIYVVHTNPPLSNACLSSNIRDPLCTSVDDRVLVYDYERCISAPITSSSSSCTIDCSWSRAQTCEGGTYGEDPGDVHFQHACATSSTSDVYRAPNTSASATNNYMSSSATCINSCTGQILKTCALPPDSAVMLNGNLHG